MNNLKKRIITLNELKKLNCSTWSKKDSSPRGCRTVNIDQLCVGDEVLIDNFFTLIVK